MPKEYGLCNSQRVYGWKVDGLDNDPGSPERVGTSWINTGEAQWAADKFYTLPGGSKAILCYYQAQVDLIREKFMIDEVYTIDSIQGLEWDHVILLVTRPDYHPHTIEPGLPGFHVGSTPPFQAAQCGPATFQNHMAPQLCEATTKQKN